MEAKRQLFKMSGNDTHDASTLLFEESRFIEERKQNKVRQEQLKLQFKPTINKKSESMVKLLGKKFYQRLEAFNHNKEAKLSRRFVLL